MSNYLDGIAVGRLINMQSYRKSNADFNPIVNALTRINNTNQAQEIEYKSLKDLLPNMLTSFYTYSGSLTTPPCYQVVNWIIMSDRLYLNAKQIEMFRNLYAPATVGGSAHQHSSPSTAGQVHGNGNSNDDNDHDQLESSASAAPLIMPNNRQIQPLNNRTILASFAPLSRLEQLQIGSSSSTSSAGSASSSLMMIKQLNVFVVGGYLIAFFSILRYGAPPLLPAGGFYLS